MLVFVSHSGLSGFVQRITSGLGGSIGGSFVTVDAECLSRDCPGDTPEDHEE